MVPSIVFTRGFVFSIHEQRRKICGANREAKRWRRSGGEAVDRLCFPPAAPLLTHMQKEIISISAKHKRKQLLVHNVCSVIAPCEKEKGCTREKRYCTTLKATKAE
jgi:hypothetical protein